MGSGIIPIAAKVAGVLGGEWADRKVDKSRWDLHVGVQPSPLRREGVVDEPDVMVPFDGSGDGADFSSEPVDDGVGLGRDDAVVTSQPAELVVGRGGEGALTGDPVLPVPAST